MTSVMISALDRFLAGCLVVCSEQSKNQKQKVAEAWHLFFPCVFLLIAESTEMSLPDDFALNLSCIGKCGPHGAEKKRGE